jgi:exonuclease III
VSIATWNVNSWTLTNGRVRADILAYLDLDIILITETKLPMSENISIDGYKWYGNNRSFIKKTARSASGGVGILLKNDIVQHNYIKVTDTTQDGILSLCLTDKTTTKQISITVCYLPPEGSQYGRDTQNFYDHLLQNVYNAADCDMIIMGGDLNGRIGTNMDYIPEVDVVAGRKPLDLNSNRHGDALIEFLKESKQCILNGRITPELDNYTSVSSRGKAVVDYMITSHSTLNQFTRCEVHLIKELCNKMGYKPESKLPDHSIVVSEFRNFMWSAEEEHGCNKNSRPRRVRSSDIPPNFLQSYECQKAINNTIRKLHHINTTQKKVDTLYEEVLNIYNKEMDEILPRAPNEKTDKKRKKFTAKPWWNDELTAKWQLAVKAEKDFLKHKGSRAGKAGKHARYKHLLKDFDKSYNQGKRKFMSKQGQDIQELSTSDPNEFWKKIKQLGPSTRKEDIPMEVPNEDGSSNFNVKDVLHHWQEAFEDLYQNGGDFDEDFHQRVKVLKDNFDAFDDSEYGDTVPQAFEVMDNPITYNEVQRAVNKAKLNKAVGYDHIPNEVLKNLPTIRLLQELFNSCFRSGIIPSSWCKSLIKPIPKGSSNDKRLPTNYRGISLLSNIYKLYASVLNSRLTTFLEANQKIVEEQNGFRSLRACIDHLYTLTCIIRNRKLEGKDTFACFVDMRKAFDVVDRTSLLFKLSQVGVCKHLYESIAVIYQKTECTVLIGDYLTDWFSTLGGVKQGDNLSPALFSIYINDLAEELNSANLGVQIDQTFINILLYADDLVIIAEDEKNLQAMLEIVDRWCKKWRMNINATKTEVIHFRKESKPKSAFQFKCGKNNIGTVKTYKYLGCILDENLDFTVTANTLADAAGRAVGSLVNKCIKSNNLVFKTYSKLYESCIIPIMDYAAGVWGFPNYDRPNTVQNRAIRSFLGVHRYASNVAIQGDVGWKWPVVRRKIEMLKLFKRIMLMDDDRLTKKMLIWDWKHKGYSWSRCIRSIFKGTGQENLCTIDIFHTQSVLDFDVIIKTAEKELMTVEINKWHSELVKQPKLRTYRLFKTTFMNENYLLCNMSRSTRSFIAQLRSGILPLKIETGRFLNKKVEERICDYCKGETVEDEIHFILHCPLYAFLRIIFFNHVNQFYNITTMSDNEKMNVFMTDNKIICKFGTFIRNCYYKRTDFIYNHSVS